MGDEIKDAPPDFLSEFRSGRDIGPSVDKLNIKLQAVEKSINSNLIDHHRNFLAKAEQISQNAADLRELSCTIDKLNSKYHGKIKPDLENVECSLSNKSVLRGTLSSVHSRAVDELERLLKLHKRCQDLLNIHNKMEILKDSVNHLLHHYSYGDHQTGDQSDDYSDSDETLYEEDFESWKTKSPPSCGEIGAKVTDVVVASQEVANLMNPKTFSENSQVMIFQALQNSWVERKLTLHRFVKHYWSRMVRITTELEDRSALARLELVGTTGELQCLLRLTHLVRETQTRVQEVVKRLWEAFFVPWLDSMAGDSKSAGKRLKFEMDESVSNIWSLSLVKEEEEEGEAETPHHHYHHGASGLEFIVHVCQHLLPVLKALSQRLLSLSATTDAAPEGATSASAGHRLIDLCVPQLPVFNLALARTLRDRVFRPHLPSPDTEEQEEEEEEEEEEEKVSKALAVSNGSIAPLVKEAAAMGYLGPEAADCLLDLLADLQRPEGLNRDRAWVRALLRIIAKPEVFTQLVKVGGDGAFNEESEENSLSSSSRRGEMSESELEDAELAKLFDNLHLNFPACYVSKAVEQVLALVERVIREVGAQSIDREATATATTARRVSRLIYLYAHCVPTLHAERFKTDLKFVATYYNDCMYLAHQCLTLGRRSVAPLVETADEGQVSTQVAASVSTLQIVAPLRHAATSALLGRLRAEKTRLEGLFKASRGLKDCAGEGRDECEQAIAGCISLLVSVSRALECLPVATFLRAIGTLAAELVRSVGDAVVALEDITTFECTTLLLLVDSVTKSVRELFEPHLDAAFSSASGGSVTKTSEKTVEALLERRVASWQRLLDIRSILAASSLEEISLLTFTKKGSHLHLSHDEISHLVCALYKPSNARSNLLRSLAAEKNKMSD